MSYNREAIDQIRKANGQEPISDAEFSALSGQPVIVDKVEEGKDGDENKDKPEPAKVETPVAKEYSEEELMEMVSAKAGRKITSWDELKPKPEELDAERQKEERETNKFIWGLQNKVIKKEENEAYIQDSKDIQQLVYRQRLQAALAEDPNLSEDEFKSEFEEEFGINAAEGSRRNKNGKDTLNRLAGEILKSTYSGIYELESKYSQFEQQSKAQKEREAKIKEGAPAYKQALDSVKAELKKIKAEINPEESFEIEAIDEDIDQVVSMLSDPEWASEQILKGTTKEQLKDIAWTALLKQSFPKLALQVAKQYHLKKAAGTKGIIKMNTGGEGEEYQLTEAQKVLVDLHKQNNPELAGSN